MYNQKGKTAVLILILLVVILLAISGGVSYLLQQERLKNTNLSQQLSDLQEKQKITETKLDETTRNVSLLDTKLQDAKSKIGNLTSDLAAERSAKESALTQIDQLRTDLNQQKSLRADLEAKLARAQKDQEALNTKLSALDANKVELEVRIKDLEAKTAAIQQSVELGTVVVNPETTVTAPNTNSSKAAKKTEKPKAKNQGAVKKAAPQEAGPAPVAAQPQAAQPKTAVPAPVEGKVLVLNRDYNFAVISLGNRNGIVTGDVFAVFHNNAYLGDVKVEKTHDSMSAAGFLSDSVKNKVSEGDRVVKK